MKQGTFKSEENLLHLKKLPIKFPKDEEIMKFEDLIKKIIEKSYLGENYSKLKDKLTPRVSVDALAFLTFINLLTLASSDT